MNRLPQMRDLIYSTHAKKEWIREELGIIRKPPRKFIKSSCKKIEHVGENKIRVTYQYHQIPNMNIVLVINTESFVVITNYLDRQDKIQKRR